MANAPTEVNGGSTDIETHFESVFGNMEPSPDNTEESSTSTEQEASEQDATGQAPQSQEDAQPDLFNGLQPALKDKPQRDAQGNILDKDGKVLASTREERRELFNFNRLRLAADTLREQNTTLRAENDQLRVMKEMPGRLGLSLDQVSEAMEFRAKVERDPVAAVREIVARVMQNGYTIQQLFGEDAPGYINAQIVSQQVAKHLQPLNERLAASTREEALQRQVEQDVNNFVAEHEFAILHQNAIVQLAEEHGMKPEKAYYELRSWADRNGFDFSQPLQPQVLARMQQAQKQKAPASTRTTPGGVRPATSYGSQPSKASVTASPNSSFREIVEAAFQNR